MQINEKLIGSYKTFKNGLFVSASCLVVYVALRNLLTWNLVEFWGRSRNVLSSIWAVFYWMSGESFFNISVFGSWLLVTSTFIVANMFFMVLDLTGKPAALLKYKIQEGKGVPVSWKKYKKVIWRFAFNSVVVGLIFNLFTYPLAVWRGMDVGYDLPSFAITIWHLFGFIVLHEISFYYCHRLLHHPTLFKYIHKTHHEWIAPTGLAAIYSHPLEHFISTLGTAFFGPIIMGSHLSVAWLWYVVAVLSTTVAHSGYHFPFLPSSEAHDYHHQKFNQIFGSIGVLDRVHGTDTLFRQSKNYERHVLLLGLSSVKEVYPDPPKSKVNHN